MIAERPFWREGESPVVVDQMSAIPASGRVIGLEEGFVFAQAFLADVGRVAYDRIEPGLGFAFDGGGGALARAEKDLGEFEFPMEKAFFPRGAKGGFGDRAFPGVGQDARSVRIAEPGAEIHAVEEVDGGADEFAFAGLVALGGFVPVGFIAKPLAGVDIEHELEGGDAAGGLFEFTAGFSGLVAGHVGECAHVPHGFGGQLKTFPLRAPEHALARFGSFADLFDRDADEAVAAFDVVVEKRQGRAQGETIEPERDLGQFDGHGVEVNP